MVNSILRFWISNDYKGHDVRTNNLTVLMTVLFADAQARRLNLCLRVTSCISQNSSIKMKFSILQQKPFI